MMSISYIPYLEALVVIIVARVDLVFIPLAHSSAAFRTRLRIRKNVLPRPELLPLMIKSNK